MIGTKRGMLPRSYPSRPAGFNLFAPSLAGSRLALAAGALAIGLSGAFVRERGLVAGFPDWPPAIRFLLAQEPRFSPPAVPFLREQADDEGDSALREGAMPGAAPEAAAPVDLAAAAQSLGRDLTGLKEAIAFYKSGALAQGDDAAKAATDPVVKTALEWAALWSFPRESGFARIQAFITAHPHWPARDWLRSRTEESLFGDRKSTALIASYFATSEPQTPAGKLALARALRDAGKSSEAATLARGVWREADLNPTLEARITADFGDYLQKSDYKYRADRLLYKEQTANALRAAALAGPDVLALAKARASVIAEAPSEKLFAKVPLALRADPSYKFAMIQKLRRADKISAAVSVMLSSPRDPVVLVNGDEWWVERRLLARKLLDQGDAKTAYKLCAEHSAMTREMQIEAEFHAGWIALRFLNDPARAAAHFETLDKLAVTPMSRARAAYWRARAAEASASADADVDARAFYQAAASLSLDLLRPARPRQTRFERARSPRRPRPRRRAMRATIRSRSSNFSTPSARKASPRRSPSKRCAISKIRRRSRRWRASSRGSRTRMCRSPSASSRASAASRSTNSPSRPMASPNISLCKIPRTPRSSIRSPGRRARSTPTPSRARAPRA